MASRWRRAGGAVRADRPERGRQNQRPQLHQRDLSWRGPHPLSRSATFRPATARHRRPRHRPHLSAWRAVSAPERARQHHGRAAYTRCYPSPQRGLVPAERAPPRGAPARSRLSASSSSSNWKACAMPRPGRFPSAPRSSSGWRGRWRSSLPCCCSMSPRPGFTRDERDDLARFILRIKHELRCR